MSCLLDGCGKPVYSRKLCYEHWELAFQDDLISDHVRAPRKARLLGLTPTQKRNQRLAGRTFLYVMANALGHHKVGVSRDPEAREITLRNNVPFAVTTVFVCVADRYMQSERAAHFLLRNCRVKGEWFACSERQAIDAVISALDNHQPVGMGNWALPKKGRAAA